MCLCESEKPFLTREVVDEGMFGWGQLPQTVDKILYDEVGVLIDRRDETFLRLVNLADYNCMDAGANIEINFCPFCGKNFKQCK